MYLYRVERIARILERLDIFNECYWAWTDRFHEELIKFNKHLLLWCEEDEKCDMRCKVCMEKERRRQCQTCL